jgi:hypothetical protein
MHIIARENCELPPLFGTTGYHSRGRSGKFCGNDNRKTDMEKRIKETELRKVYDVKWLELAYFVCFNVRKFVSSCSNTRSQSST